jgi:uncharacterized protein (UPF0333 family)
MMEKQKELKEYFEVKRVKGQVVIEYVFIALFLIISFSGIFYFYKTSMQKYYTRIARIVCSPLP